MTFLTLLDHSPVVGKERSEELSALGSTTVCGPLLRGILAAQREAESIVSDYGLLSGAAGAVVQYLDGLRSPLVWPVGEAANRLVGAASLFSAGALRQRGWTDDLHGERVVVLGVADVTTLSLQQAARHARQLGAADIYGCRVGLEDVGVMRGGDFDDFATLTIAAPTEIVLRRV